MEAEPKSEGASSQVNLDQAKLDLDRWKAEEDLKLRRDELEIKRKEALRLAWSSPLLLAIVGVFTTIIVSRFQSSSQSEANLMLERQRFESSLIQKAIEGAEPGDAAQRLKFFIDLGLITKTERLERYVNCPGDIPFQPRESVPLELSRRDAKLSVGNGPILQWDLINVIRLPSEHDMRCQVPPITTATASARVAEEQENVRFRAFLYAATRENDDDYHLIVGSETGSETYMMTAVVTRLPPRNSHFFSQLKSARDSFEAFFGSHTPNFSYDFYDPPIPVEIEGSLLFNLAGIQGPETMRPHVKTAWEVHPVTKILFRRGDPNLVPRALKPSEKD